MPILPILQYPDPLLREVSEPVGEITEGTRDFISDMELTMYAGDGAGLSAIQVGSPQRIFIVNPAALGGRVSKSVKRLPTLVFIDPEIVELRGELMDVEEGCLSLPDVWIRVSRHTEVVIRARNRQGTEFEMDTDGFQARVIQHEYDHLDGKIILDHASKLRRKMIHKKFTRRR